MEKLKNIVIVSHFYAPEITPRAFRTRELAVEMARRGWQVTLVLPNKQAFRDNPCPTPGIEVIYAEGAATQTGTVKRKSRIKAFMPQWLIRLVLYFYNHEYFAKYDRGITAQLMKLSGDFEAIISISYPAAIHRSVCYALRHNPNLKVRVRLAEFSDPPLRGEFNRHFLPTYHWVLRRWASCFDRFVIPVENALPCYIPYKSREQIAIIAQGFDLSETRVHPYTPNPTPTFAYAGRFYRITRDPLPLFEHLTTLTIPFRFEIYLIQAEPYFLEMIERYSSRVRGEIVLHEALPRKELLAQLSHMDFILNYEFTYATATPSKLIDCAIAARPVLSFNSENFDATRFDRFLAGDYSTATPLPDLAQYDIRHVADQFEYLIAGIE